MYIGIYIGIFIYMTIFLNIIVTVSEFSNMFIILHLYYTLYIYNRINEYLSFKSSKFYKKHFDLFDIYWCIFCLVSILLTACLVKLFHV